MKAAVKKLWVDALRSGDYEQGTGALRSSRDKFCCLGVLSDVAAKAGVIPPPVLSTAGYDYSYDGNIVGLGLNVQAWAGLDDWNPVIDPGMFEYPDGEDRSQATAWAANDHLGWSFDRIADAIEQNIPSDDE